MMKPLVPCVTRQAELARQPVSALRSKGTCPSRLPVHREKISHRTRRRTCSLRAHAETSGVAFGLFPFGLKRQNLLPVAALDLWNIRLVRNSGAPADGI